MSVLDVLVATPLGRGGKGGMDRLSDSVADHIHASGRTDVRVTVVATRGPGPVLFAPFYLCLFLARLVFRSATGRCDVVHLNVASRGSTRRKALIATAARLFGIPYVVHLHGASFREFYEGGGPGVQQEVRTFFRSAAAVIVLGKIWQDFVESNGIALHDRIRVLPNASPVSSLSSRQSPDGSVRVLFLGVLGPRKGTPQLVEAFARLPIDPAWRATLAGNGDEVETRAAVRARGLDSRVEVLGWQDSDATASLLAASDVLVLPSFAENLPMAVIEGMAAGLAVVTTPVGATPDIITDGETGLLVPPGDVEALANALQRVITDSALRSRLGENARAFHKEHLEIGAYVDKLVRIWKAAAA